MVAFTNGEIRQRHRDVKSNDNPKQLPMLPSQQNHAVVSNKVSTKHLKKFYRKCIFVALASLLFFVKIWIYVSPNFFSSEGTVSNEAKSTMYTKNVPSIRPVVLKLHDTEFGLYLSHQKVSIAGRAWDSVIDMTMANHTTIQEYKMKHTIYLSEDEYNSLYYPVDSDEERERGKLILPADYSDEALVGKRDKFVDGDCIQMEDWQLHDGFPTCNFIHEHDIAYKNHHNRVETIRFLAHGYWRDVWKINDWEIRPFVLKTQRYDHDFTDRNFDRQRRDGLASERLTSSPYVVNIYAYCAYSGFYEYSDGGDIEHLIWSSRSPNYSSFDALKVARDISAGIASAHTFDGEYATLAHADITPGQFVLIDGHYRLNDFNRCRFIRWNNAKQQPCPFHIHGNPGTFRSPEEYNTLGDANRNILSEKIDVFSMGNVFFSLITKEWPFESSTHHDEVKAQKKIIKGHTPHISDDLRHNTDPSIQAILTAMKRCYILDPAGRATAQEVHAFLSRAVDAIEKGKQFNTSEWTR